LYKDNKFRWWWPCVVKEVHSDDDTLYTVEILEKFPTNLNNTRKLVTTMTHFSRHLIRFHVPLWIKTPRWNRSMR